MRRTHNNADKKKKEKKGKEEWGKSGSAQFVRSLFKNQEALFNPILPNKKSIV